MYRNLVISNFIFFNFGKNIYSLNLQQKIWQQFSPPKNSLVYLEATLFPLKSPLRKEEGTYYAYYLGVGWTLHLQV
jgi:hypothetical protein